MRVHYLQHVTFEDPGYFLTIFKNLNFTVSLTRMWLGESLPEMDDFDLLLILGGPMNVYETEKYKWLNDEKKFIKEALNKNKKIIGICLGAQLIAHVLGAKIFPNEYPEIGWFPVNLSPDFQKWINEPAPAQINFFHWHGDTYEIPFGAICQASSKACDNQIFTFSTNVIGIQFHPEITPVLLDQMISHEGNELIKSRFVQCEEQIRLNSNFMDGNIFISRLVNNLVNHN